MKITISEVISAPIARVFDVMSDISKAEERIPGIEKIDILSDIKSGEGLHWRETRVMFGKEATEEMAIVKYDPPTYYCVDAASHGMEYRSEYTFSEVNGATNLEMIFMGIPKSLGAKIFAPIMAIFFKGATKKALEKDILELKALLEEEAAGGAS